MNRAAGKTARQFKNRLFWRLFWAFLATLTLTVLVLSSLVVAMVRSERQDALENEVLMQARDVARLFRQLSSISFRRGDPYTISTTLAWKLNEVRTVYGAEVWVISGDGESALVMDEQVNKEIAITDQDLRARIHFVLENHEIRVQGLIPDLGKDIVTVGVPIVDVNGMVNGAVLMHISVDSLQVDYTDILRYALIAAGAAMLVGTGLAYWISRRQTQPLRQINSSVTRFASGDLDERVAVKGSDEMAQLAASFNKMAEDLSNLEESRRSFVASVSHELRSPLTCISGYVQGMLDGTIPENEHGKYLQIVKSEAARLTKLVAELLDLSRIESGKFPLTLNSFDINELMRVELLKFEQRIEEKKLDVDVIFKESACMVSADADRIRQVVTNLLDNAVKFTPEGGALTVSTHSVDKTCFVQVKNSGDPIAAEDIPFLFDRFYKAEKAHTSGMGTGLGLSIAQKILEQHGQVIKVQSGAGGTAFTFTLRCV